GVSRRGPGSGRPADPPVVVGRIAGLSGKRHRSPSTRGGVDSAGTQAVGAEMTRGVMNRWQTIRKSSLGRHDHTRAYAALVLAGPYEEAGDLGHYEVQAGDVVLHDEFEAHLDRFAGGAATVLNLTIPAGLVFHPGVAQVADPEGVVRLAEKGRREALQC